MSIRPLIDWLDYDGNTVITKATKEFIDASGRRKVKGDMVLGTSQSLTNDCNSYEDRVAG